MLDGFVGVLGEFGFGNGGGGTVCAGRRGEGVSFGMKGKKGLGSMDGWLTDVDVQVRGGGVVEQVLQQIIPILLLPPLLHRPQDILHILQNPTPLLPQPRGPRARSTRSFENIRGDDKVDEFGDLVLRGEFTGLERAEGLGELDALGFGGEGGLDLGAGGEVVADGLGEEGLGFGHGG